MLFNPFLAQRLAEEQIKDALREAEQERLARRATVVHRPSSVVRQMLLVLGLVSLTIIVWRLV